MPGFVLDASVTLAWNGTAALARRHGLTHYDAACRSLALAAFDDQLARAATAEKVPLAMDAAP